MLIVNLFKDYELDEIGLTASGVDDNAEKHENEVLQVNPMIILPLNLPRIAKKVFYTY